MIELFSYHRSDFEEIGYGAYVSNTAYKETQYLDTRFLGLGGCKTILYFMVITAQKSGSFKSVAECYNHWYTNLASAHDFWVFS